jgi:hypothetical protein
MLNTYINQKPARLPAKAGGAPHPCCGPAAGKKKFDGTKGAAESHLSKILIKIRLIMHR